MVAVFAVFATLSQIDMKMMGVGLAVAVLIDATIVRAVLLPATMQLLGDRNWYLPAWLKWLPHVHHEGAVPCRAARARRGAGGRAARRHAGLSSAGPPDPGSPATPSRVVGFSPLGARSPGRTVRA
jgi:RND superfamily putative drug exporter